MDQKNRILPSIGNLKEQIVKKSSQKDHVYTYEKLFNNFIGKKSEENIPKPILQENIQYDIRETLQEEYEPRTKTIYDNESEIQDKIKEIIWEQDNLIIKENNKILEKWQIQWPNDILDLMKLQYDNNDIIRNTTIEEKTLKQIFFQDIEQNFLGKESKNNNKLEKIIYKEILKKTESEILNNVSIQYNKENKKKWAEMALIYTELKFAQSSSDTIEKVFNKKSIPAKRDLYYWKIIDEFLQEEEEEDISIDNITKFQQWCEAIKTKDHYVEEISSQYFIIEKA